MPDHRLAVLIDAENVPSANWPNIAAAVHQIGRPTIVRAYICNEGAGKYWAQIAAVTMVNGRPASGGNAADFLLAMDAVDIALREPVDEIIIVSADGDFAAVIHHLRRWIPRISVLIAPNNHKAPPGLVAAADLALVLPPATHQPDIPPPGVVDGHWKSLLLGFLQTMPTDKNGWIELSEIGLAIKESGCRVPGKLLDRVRSLTGAEVRQTGTQYFVRLKGP